MDITFLELRRMPGKILEALKRREPVTLSHRGKPVARIEAIENKRRCGAAEHPAFGMWADRPDMQDASQYVRSLRKGRFDAL